jgi:large subunit ribosomal protein L9
MEVILLETIQNIGGLGDRVNVKPGFARNFLVPSGKALTATRANVAVFEERRVELEAKLAIEVKSAQGRAEKIEEVELRIERKAGVGRLFGSVSATDIVQALGAAGIEVHRGEVRLPDGPIRNTGEFDIAIRVHPNVDAQLKVVVVSADQDDDEEEILEGDEVVTSSDECSDEGYDDADPEA